MTYIVILIRIVTINVFLEVRLKQRIHKSLNQKNRHDDCLNTINVVR